MAMKQKTPLTRSLLAACSIVALSAVMYGCSSGGGDDAPAVEQPDPDAEARALAAAQNAAMTAWHGARDALAGIAGKENANPAAYQRAMNALTDAKAAHDAAAAATTSAEAQQHQAAAEAANTEAMAQVAMVVASVEAPALSAAQMAASSAAEAAEAASDAAAAAVAAVEAISGDDEASYDVAVAQAAAAQAASDAAAAASADAAATMDLAEAEAQQAAAAQALADASAANTAAMESADMVRAAHDDAVAADAAAEAMALADAKGAAQSAYDAAKMAYDAAKARFDALEDKKADNVADHVRAMDALARVKAAYDAAMAANAMAQAATTSTDAASHQATVETQKAAVDTLKMGVDMYAGNVETAYTAAQAVRDNMAAEAKALADAQKAAMDAATAAQTAATEARTQATKVSEALGPNSDSTTAANAAATAAEEAATAAEEASARAQEDTDSADAMAEQKTAEGKQSEAEMKLADATELARQAGVATAGLDQLRIELARDGAEEAKDAAAKAAAAAHVKATDAREQAENARADANMAMRARTDYANADEHADTAEAAATAAEAAATAAETASEAAEAEHTKTMAADVSVEDARAARDEARSQRNTAIANNTGDDGAAAKYMEAMEAAADAKKYAAMHVLGLLKMANDVSAPDADTRDATITAVAAAIDSAAGLATDTDNNSSTNNGKDNVSATAEWVADTQDKPDTDDNEFMAGLPVVTITGVGTDIASDTVGVPDADPVEKPNAKSITGLPGFMQGFDISSDDGRHVLVFTDIEQEEAKVEAVKLKKAVQITNKPAVASRIVLPPLATKLDKASYDHDGDPDTNPLEPATLTCGSLQPTDCSFEIEDGKLTSLVGYVVTVTGNVGFELASEKPAARDNSYLAFGVWLQDDKDNKHTFGAFAGGGAKLGNVDLVAVTGTARYTGAATGVYTAGSSVDYFQGDATLTASFGPAKPDTAATPPVSAEDAQGSISGKIDGIVAGGTSMSDVINLSSAALSKKAGDGFRGNARMGNAIVNEDAATVTFPYIGRWSGDFYNQAENESLTTAPGSVAGTFGVTGTMGEGDDAMTRSYVGAFGAHKTN